MWWRRKRSDDEDYDDEFTLSGPEKTGFPAPLPPPQLTANPFLIAGGYNFDVDQNGHANGSPNSTSMGHSREASQAAAGFGHGYHNLNEGHSGGEHSFNSDSNNNNTNDFTFLDPPADSPPELGRRRLSVGSLPDIIARQPGSLKVVNN